jgi:hypothetical protein
MWRWVKILLLVACAMIAVAAGFVHWRSYRVSSVGHYYAEKGWAGIYCARGEVIVGIGREPVDAVVKHDYYERPVKKGKDDMDFEGMSGGQRIGVGYFQSRDPRVHYVLAPLWVVWGLASVPMFVVGWKEVRKRWRKSMNLCEGCGYDLRGSSGRCPECGREMAVVKLSLLYNP